jgi:hypothetical protein
MTIFYCLRFETPQPWKARSPYLCHPGTGWPSYTPRHWVPFSSPPTTSRARVEELEPTSTWGHCISGQTQRKTPFSNNSSTLIEVLGPYTTIISCSDDVDLCKLNTGKNGRMLNLHTAPWMCISTHPLAIFCLVAVQCYESTVASIIIKPWRRMRK